jgi:hypothetical protein
MSLQINQDKITRVLLADGWHDARGFGTDAYEFGAYFWDRDWGANGSPRFHCEHGGGDSGVCATGFAFTDAATGETVAGPLTAILAIAGPGICASPGPGDPGVHGQPAPARGAMP